MARRFKWLARALYGLGIVAALAFGTRQAVAGARAGDPCVCQIIGQTTDECDACCGGPGFCTLAHYCLC
ncbi:MAG TPA: hypothetical protein VGA02_06215 [Gemmatimonadales bacterium]|jgi:hypothetical protein